MIGLVLHVVQAVLDLDLAVSSVEKASLVMRDVVVVVVIVVAIVVAVESEEDTEADLDLVSVTTIKSTHECE